MFEKLQEFELDYLLLREQALKNARPFVAEVFGEQSKPYIALNNAIGDKLPRISHLENVSVA